MKKKAKVSDNFYLNVMSQFDGVQNFMRVCCYAIQFIKNKKLMGKFIKYLKQQDPSEEK